VVRHRVEHTAHHDALAERPGIGPERENLHVRRVLLVLVLLLGSGAFGGCVGGAASHGTRTTARAARPAAAQPIPLRGCETSAYGDLGRTPVNRVGPIGFVDSWSNTQPIGERRGSRIRPTKVLVVVDVGATVTVTIPDVERDSLRLLYAAPTPDSPDGFYEFAAGENATTFQACLPGQKPFGDHPQTQFPGYFLVTGPGCYRVDVTQPGLSHRAYADLSLGQRC
jgi:hypothetical protein